MFRKIAIAIALMAMLALGMSPANADGSGSCAVNGGNVSVHVNEDPNEGDVSYLSIASTVRLDDDTTQSVASQRTRGSLWYEAYPYGQIPASSSAGGGGIRYAFSSPVDGNGFWNYRINFYRNAGGDQYLRAGRVHVNLMKYNSTSECYVDIYI